MPPRDELDTLIDESIAEALAPEEDLDLDELISSSISEVEGAAPAPATALDAQAAPLDPFAPAVSESTGQLPSTKPIQVREGALEELGLPGPPRREPSPMLGGPQGQLAMRGIIGLGQPVLDTIDRVYALYGRKQPFRTAEGVKELENVGLLTEATILDRIVQGAGNVASTVALVETAVPALIGAGVHPLLATTAGWSGWTALDLLTRQETTGQKPTTSDWAWGAAMTVGGLPAAHYGGKGFVRAVEKLLNRPLGVQAKQLANNTALAGIFGSVEVAQGEDWRVAYPANFIGMTVAGANKALFPEEVQAVTTKVADKQMDATAAMVDHLFPQTAKVFEGGKLVEKQRPFVGVPQGVAPVSPAEMQVRVARAEGAWEQAQLRNRARSSEGLPTWEGLRDEFGISERDARGIRATGLPPSVAARRAKVSPMREAEEQTAREVEAMEQELAPPPVPRGVETRARGVRTGGAPVAGERPLPFPTSKKEAGQQETQFRVSRRLEQQEAQRQAQTRAKLGEAVSKGPASKLEKPRAVQPPPLRPGTTPPTGLVRQAAPYRRPEEAAQAKARGLRRAGLQPPATPTEDLPGIGARLAGRGPVPPRQPPREGKGPPVRGVVAGVKQAVPSAAPEIGRPAEVKPAEARVQPPRPAASTPVDDIGTGKIKATPPDAPLRDTPDPVKLVEPMKSFADELKALPPGPPPAGVEPAAVERAGKILGEKATRPAFEAPPEIKAKRKEKFARKSDEERRKVIGAINEATVNIQRRLFDQKPGPQHLALAAAAVGAGALAASDEDDETAKAAGLVLLGGIFRYKKPPVLAGPAGPQRGIVEWLKRNYKYDAERRGRPLGTDAKELRAMLHGNPGPKAMEEVIGKVIEAYPEPTEPGPTVAATRHATWFAAAENKVLSPQHVLSTKFGWPGYVTEVKNQRALRRTAQHVKRVEGKEAFLDPGPFKAKPGVEMSEGKRDQLTHFMNQFVWKRPSAEAEIRFEDLSDQQKVSALVGARMVGLPAERVAGRKLTAEESDAIERLRTHARETYQWPEIENNKVGRVFNPLRLHGQDYLPAKLSRLVWETPEMQRAIAEDNARIHEGKVTTADIYRLFEDRVAGTQFDVAYSFPLEDWALGKAPNIDLHRLNYSLIGRNWDMWNILHSYLRPTTLKIEAAREYGPKGEIAGQLVRLAGRLGYNPQDMAKLHDTMLGQVDRHTRWQATKAAALLREWKGWVGFRALGGMAPTQVTQVLQTAIAAPRVTELAQAVPRGIGEALALSTSVPRPVREALAKKLGGLWSAEAGVMAQSAFLQEIGRIRGVGPKLVQYETKILYGQFADRVQRSVATAHARLIARTYLAEFDKNPTGRSPRAQLVELFGGDPALLAKATNPKRSAADLADLLDDAAYILNGRTQFFLNSATLPLMAQHPVGQAIFQLQGFAMRSTAEAYRIMNDVLLHPRRNPGLWWRTVTAIGLSLYGAHQWRYVKARLQGRDIDEMKEEPFLEQLTKDAATLGVGAGIWNTMETIRGEYGHPLIGLAGPGAQTLVDLDQALIRSIRAGSPDPAAKYFLRSMTPRPFGIPVGKKIAEGMDSSTGRRPRPKRRKPKRRVRRPQ